MWPPCFAPVLTWLLRTPLLQIVRGKVQLSDGSVLLTYSDPQDSFIGVASVTADGTVQVIGTRETPSGRKLGFRIVLQDPSRRPPSAKAPVGAGAGVGVGTGAGAGAAAAAAKPTVKLPVHTMTGGRFTAEVQASDLMDRIYSMVRSHEALGPNRRTLLVYNGRVLPPEKTVAECGLGSGCHVYSVQRFRG